MGEGSYGRREVMGVGEFWGQGSFLDQGSFVSYGSRGEGKKNLFLYVKCCPTIEGYNGVGKRGKAKNGEVEGVEIGGGWD